MPKSYAVPASHASAEYTDDLYNDLAAEAAKSYFHTARAGDHKYALHDPLGGPNMRAWDRAVYAQIVPPELFLTGDVAEMEQFTRKRWRNCLEEIRMLADGRCAAQSHWAGFRDPVKMAYMRNCPPSRFAHRGRDGHPCHLPICPYCHALDRVLPAMAAVRQACLDRRHGGLHPDRYLLSSWAITKFRFPLSVKAACEHVAARGWSDRLNVIARPLGACRIRWVAPLLVKGRLVGTRLIERQLAVVAAHISPPQGFGTNLPYTTYSKLSHEKIADAVACTMRYPGEYLGQSDDRIANHAGTVVAFLKYFKFRNVTWQGVLHGNRRCGP